MSHPASQGALFANSTVHLSLLLPSHSLPRFLTLTPGLTLTIGFLHCRWLDKVCALILSGRNHCLLTGEEPGMLENCCSVLLLAESLKCHDGSEFLLCLSCMAEMLSGGPQSLFLLSIKQACFMHHSKDSICTSQHKFMTDPTFSSLSPKSLMIFQSQHSYREGQLSAVIPDVVLDRDLQNGCHRLSANSSGSV